ILRRPIERYQRIDRSAEQEQLHPLLMRQLHDIFHCGTRGKQPRTRHRTRRARLQPQKIKPAAVKELDDVVLRISPPAERSVVIQSHASNRLDRITWSRRSAERRGNAA